MINGFAVSRRVNKAKEVIYTCKEVMGVLSNPSPTRKLLIVTQRKEDDPVVQRMVSKAKARDGVAGYQMYSRHTFTEREDGVVQIRNMEESVA